VSPRREDGQVLLLALAFLGFAALLIGAMLSFAYESENTSVQLQSQRSTSYAADGATDAAIQTGRIDNTVGGYGDSRCQASVPNSFGSSPTVLLTTSLNGVTAKVICSYSSDPLQSDRTVTFTTFTSFGSAAAPTVQAQVIYHDSTAGSGQPKVDVISWTYCGHSTSC